METDLTKPHIYIDGFPVNKQMALHSRELLNALKCAYANCSQSKMTKEAKDLIEQAIKKATS